MVACNWLTWRVGATPTSAASLTTTWNPHHGPSVADSMKLCQRKELGMQMARAQSSRVEMPDYLNLYYLAVREALNII